MGHRREPPGAHLPPAALIGHLSLRSVGACFDPNYVRDEGRTAGLTSGSSSGLELGEVGRCLNCAFNRCAWRTTDGGSGQGLCLGYTHPRINMLGAPSCPTLLPDFQRGAVPGVGGRLTFPPLRPYRRGHVGRVGPVGSLFRELRARASLAPPSMPKPGWGCLSGASRGGSEVCKAYMSR